MSRKIPTIETSGEEDFDVHAPAATYYTTGSNARNRTRTYTVMFSGQTLLVDRLQSLCNRN